MIDWKASVRSAIEPVTIAAKSFRTISAVFESTETQAAPERVVINVPRPPRAPGAVQLPPGPGG